MRRPGLRSTSSDQRNGSVSPYPSMRAVACCRPWCCQRRCCSLCARRALLRVVPVLAARLASPRPRSRCGEEDGSPSLEGVWRTVVRAAELDTSMFRSGRGWPLVTVVNGPAASSFRTSGAAGRLAVVPAS